MLLGNETGVVIAGPTASGKSRLAIALAQSHNGVVINADAMQVYSDLSVITARPDAAEMASAPHLLFGTIDGSETCSAARWARDARRAIDEIRACGRLPILVGGTGLYIAALFDGLSDVPEIPEAIRKAVRERVNADPPAGHAELLQRDPVMGGRLNAGDPQRVSRALEVLDATGQSLSVFQGAKQPLIGDEGWCFLRLDPDIHALRERIAQRAEAMLEGGAIEEVRALLQRDLDPTLPVMRAIGVPEIARFIAGTLDWSSTASSIALSTSQYAKRQRTWLNGKNGARYRRIEPA
jgi:tRNA dimethylallyltransferase